MEKVEEWLFYCRRGYTPATCKMYRSVLTQLQKSISQNGQQLSSSAVEAFLDGKFRRGGSRRQFNTYLIVIRSFAGWRQKKYGIESPVHKISFIKEDPPKQRVLSEEEYQLCLKNTHGMDHEILTFLGNTGLRKSEFAGLRWGDIPADFKYIRVAGKGRKSRIVPLNSAVREILSRYKRLPDGESLQISQRYYGNEGISWMCRRIAKKIGIPRFGAHAVRHRFATEMIKRGINIYKLSKILGHSSITTTEQIYLHLMPVDLYGLTDVLD